VSKLIDQLDFLAAKRDKLTSWELKFIGQMRERATSGKTVTPKMLEEITNLYLRLQETVATKTPVEVASEELKAI
jgi:hypothetical protein